MISVQARSRVWNAQVWASLWEDPARAAWWTAYVSQVVLTLTVLCRWMLGHFDQPLPAGQIIGWSVLVTLLSIFLRRSVQAAGYSSQQSTTVIFGSLTLAIFLFLLALSLPGTSVFGLVASWCVFVGVEASWWTSFLGQPVTIVTPQSVASDATRQTEIEMPEDSSSEDSLSDEFPDETWPAGVTQQMTRLRKEGGEMLVGGVRVDFVAGERQRAVHLGFCPPLEGPPQFHIDQSEGPEVHVDVTQCEPFGARLEVKLQQTSERAESVVLQFEAICEL
jgi:hypothetical protein